MTEIKADYSFEKEKKSKTTTYQLKVDKDIWRKFKGTSYILGFNSVNDCLNDLIEGCVNRANNAD